MLPTMKKRLTAVSLLVAILTCFVACSDETQNDSIEKEPNNDIVSAQSENDGETETEMTVEEKVAVSDDLGAYDFEGATFGMMTFQNVNFHYEMLAEEMTGKPMNDAEVNVTAEIEDRFNIDLQQQLYADFSNTPATSVQAGDTSIDLVRIRCDTATTWWSSGLSVTADNVPVIDLDKVYWDKTINDSLSIGNKQYVALSAYDLCTYDLTFSLVFNRGMITDYNLSNPYSLVTDGVWTMDAMNEMTTVVTMDMDSNGIYDKNDRYGYLSSPKMAAPGFWIGAGVLSIEKDADDVPALAIGSEKFIGVWEKIIDMTHTGNQWYGVDDGPDVPHSTRELFESGDGLFMDISFFFAEGLREMEEDFGIIPYPKYNEEQESYYTRLCYYFPTVVPVTKTGAELERCGVVLEALSCAYYNEVVPAYYDVILSNKVARDEESADMLDIIFASRVIDIGDSTMCSDLRDGVLRSAFESASTDIASVAQKIEKSLNKKLAKLLEN